MADGDEISDAEIDLFKIADTIKSLFLKHKSWVIITPICCLLLGHILSRIPSPQWEAVAIVRIGVVGDSRFIEPLDDVILGLRTKEFQTRALTKSGIPLGSSEAALYRDSIHATQMRIPRIEIKVRGYSRESALKSVSATAEEICQRHSARATQLHFGPRQRLAELEILSQEVEATLKHARQPSVERIVATYVANDFAQMRFSLLEQIESFDTATVEVGASDKPVYPKRSVWLVFAGVFGLLLGFAVPMVLGLRKG